MGSPTRIELPQVPLGNTAADITMLYRGVHNLHNKLTGEPSTAPATATDLATAITAVNAVVTRLKELGVMK